MRGRGRFSTEELVRGAEAAGPLTGLTQTQLLVSGPTRSALRRAEQRLELAPAEQVDLLPVAHRAQPPVAPARAGGQPVRERQQRVRLDRERARRASARTSRAATRRSSAANAARRAGATCSITLEE